MTRDAARHRRLMELFDQAVELSEEDRLALFARVDAEEPALAAELRALVAQDSPRDDFFRSIDGRLDVSALAAGWPEPPGPNHEHGGAPGGEDAGPREGSVIAGRYRIEALLGRGSMGSVYRARDTAAAREVAVKLLRADLMSDPRQVMRFRREFRAISRLDHPGCVAVFEEGRHLDQRYIVMEYVAGGNLGRLVGADDDVLLPVLVELTRALAYVHGRRIIHRDLKPANVLLTPGERPRPRLADFGIVKLTDELDGRLTDTGAVVGTIDFLAPEQLDGHPPDPRSDLYALGCVIFALWADRPPFLGTPLQRLRARLERNAPPLRTVAPGAPAFLDELVARLLQRDPAGRPQHASEVARVLAEQWARYRGGPATTLSPHAGQEPAVGAYLYRPGLMGRDAPTAALRERIEAAATGSPGVLVVVQGDAGLGKSALVNEVTEVNKVGRRPGSRGSRVIVAHCRGAILTPFAPFPAVLAELDEALETTVSLRPRDRARPGAPGLREADAGAALPLAGDDGAATRRRLAFEVVSKLLALQRQAPVVLVLEDLHDITDSARTLLCEMLVQLEHADAPRPAVVATMRPEGRGPLEAALRDRIEIAWIDLQPLAREAVAQIAAAMLAVGVTRVPTPLIDHLVRSCAGNPLLVQSELRALVDRGHLCLAGSEWTLDPDVMSGHAASGPEAPVRDRLAALGAPTRAILAAAAICGRRFDVELVCRATGAEQDAVIDAIDEAIRASVVQPVRARSAHGEYAFEHERLAEALREQLDADSRARCHDAIGAALEERGDTSPPVLAFHFSHGGDRGRAFGHLRAAALSAIEACDYEAAQRHLHAALERVDSLPEDAREDARAECTELLADALIMLGHTRQGIDALDRLPAATAPPIVQARWLRKGGLARLRTTDVAGGLALLQQALALLGDALPRGRLGMLGRMLRDLALTALRRVLRRAPDERDQAAEERALLHRELGLLHRWIDLERSAAHLVAFIRLAHQLGAAAYRVEAHAGAALLLSLQSWPRLAAWSHDRARQLAIESDDLHGLARAHVVRGGAAALIEGDEEAVFTHFLEGLRVAERTGDRFVMNFALSMRGWAAALLGRPGQASEDFDRADALAAELDVPWLRDDAACGRSMIELFHGDPGSAASTARRMLASDMRLALPVFEAFANEMLGGEAFIAGRFRSAVSYLERARAHYAAHRLYRGWGMGTKMLYGEALLCLVDEQGPQAVPDLMAKLRPIVRWGQRQARLPAFRGCDLLLRGVYESRRGRARVARALFAQVRAIRAGGTRVTYIDLWLRARMTLEGWRLGDAHEDVCAALDELDGLYRSAGASGMRTWLARMREIHGL